MLDDKNLITKDELSQSLKNEIYGNGDYYIPDITVEGRTLTNLLGRQGNPIYKQKSSYLNGQLTYEKEYFKVTQESEIPTGILFSMPKKINSYYVAIAELNDLPDYENEIWWDFSGKSVIKQSYIDKGNNRNNYIYCFFKIIEDSNDTAFINTGIGQGNSILIKDCRIYEISEKECNESILLSDKEILIKYPYVDDCKSVVNPYFECNENLMDYNYTSSCLTFPYPSYQPQQYNVSCRFIFLDKGIYTFDFSNIDTSIYNLSVIGYNTEGILLINKEFTIEDNKIYTFVVEEKIQLGITVSKKGVDTNNNSSNEEITQMLRKANITLVKGETPKSYEECHNSRIMFETTLYDGEKITRRNDGGYIKNSEWEEINFGDFISSSNVNVISHNNGFKSLIFNRGKITDDKNISKLIRYDGTTIKTARDGANFDYEHFYVDENGGNENIVYVIPNSLTGWGDDYTPTQEEIKAFFLGWKMYASTGSDYTEYNNNGAKCWAKLWCSIGNKYNSSLIALDNCINNTGITILPTEINDQGYTPYRLVYKKETPTIEEVKTYGELAIKDGVDVVSGSGLILGESYINHLCTYDETGSETLINCTHRFLKTKPYKILNIINDKGEIESFQDRLHNFIYPHIEAYINHGYSQAIIKYNNDIKNYFVDYIIWDTVQSYNYTISDKLSLRETLNKTTESISDVYEELAKTKKELEHTKYELSQRSNPNLLINGDFQVWQRGTEFNNIGTHKYTVDRWCAYNGISTNSYVKKLNKHGGVCIKCVADDEQSEASIALDQPLEYIENGIYTLSAKINGKIYSVTGEVVNNNFTYLINISEYILITLSRTNIAFDNRVFAQIIVKEGGEAEVEWIKLELGEYATPFVSKSYAEELRDCQRYYEVITYGGSPSGKYSNGAMFTIPYRVEKRIQNPTISFANGTIDNSVNIIDGSNGNSKSDKVMVEQVFNNNYDANPKFSYSGYTINDNIIISLKLSVDAEIY